MTDPLIESLVRAVDAQPDDMPLRRHLASLLLAAGRPAEALTHAARALSVDPADAEALVLLQRATGALAGPGPGDPAPAPRVEAEEAGDPVGFDWRSAEQQFPEAPAPKFVRDEEAEPTEDDRVPMDAWDVESSAVRLADVAGMEDVKRALDISFLGPLRNPDLRRLYGKSLRGGLLMYGPPGCGKTYLARAVAGEMGAAFMSVTSADVLDMWTGRSERNMQAVFRQARRHAPVVLFFDELDAIGQRRSSASASPALRNTINTLLGELDGVQTDNEGLFVLAATNQPWDIDPALRRPGRFDRTVLVLPPDRTARAAIFRHHLADRPIEGIDPDWLARHTDGMTGADIARVCEEAVELALADSVRTGTARMITMADLKAALGHARPSADGWFDTARNVVTFANNGEYDELRDWMRARKML